MLIAELTRIPKVEHLKLRFQEDNCSTSCFEERLPSLFKIKMVLDVINYSSEDNINKIFRMTLLM